MTPDQRFARWVHCALVVFAVVFVYFLVADLWMPVSPQARVLHPVVPLAPQVSGRVADVAVANNQRVDAGQTLFSLDRRPFELAREKAALALEVAVRENQQTDAAIASAQAELVAARVERDELANEVSRLRRVFERGGVARQQLDQRVAQHRAAKAKVQAAQARVTQLTVQRGAGDDGNLRLRQARNALAQAELSLSYSDVQATAAGVVSNLQVQPGAYAKAGMAMAALVTDQTDVVADFREKSLAHVEPGTAAAIVFDARPGEVFAAHVAGVDAGTRAGQMAADGTLAAPRATDRWVRDAQRQRLHLQLDNPPSMLSGLPSGARATVQLLPGGGVADWLGWLQIHAISLVHYIY